jgi:predicted small lipoprotein YifL
MAAQAGKTLTSPFRSRFAKVKPMHCFRDSPFLRLVLIGAFAAALALAGCGRKGPLDPPPASLTDQHPVGNSATSEKPGQPQATTVPNKRIPLDVLLN